MSLLTASAHVSLGILCVSSDRRCSRPVDPDEYFFSCFGVNILMTKQLFLPLESTRKMLFHVLLIRISLYILAVSFVQQASVALLVAFGRSIRSFVNACAYVQCRFRWVTCVSLLTASAHVSLGILCVSSDRKCSRPVDQDE